MLKGFHQYVPSTVCLVCEGCCRFTLADSCWRPKVVDQEKQEAARPAPVAKIFSANVVEPAGAIRTITWQGQHICHFFNPTPHTCGIYPGRPFECQLYPFVIRREGDKNFLCVHLPCLYIEKTRNSAEFAAYLQGLRDFLGQERVKAFLKNHPLLRETYQPYQQELETLCVLDVDA